MSTNTPDLKINYAKAFGFHSVAGAIVFAVLYVPLFGWFLRQSFARPNYVYFMLTFFCTSEFALADPFQNFNQYSPYHEVRIAAFAIRAALAGLESAGENLGLLIADEVLFGVGYFGLLYSAYTLVLDLELLSDRPPPRSPLLILIRNRRLFRLAMTAAVALGISSSTIDNGQSSTAKALHKISIIIFLILTVLQAFQTVMLAMDMEGDNGYKQGNETFGRKHVNNTAKANNEHFWYPLIAVPEILAVLLYGTPDLVPHRQELPANNTYPLNMHQQPHQHQ
ncbi:hypothetical protein GALMADRAFT_135541 [Galerina marginata CBS 339.88]|uniref:Uncharacterized protein n=1 Tax=Galerina marginata (strain CBS 339.88) TaxID=685588 RepID=A0A067TG95_GALM3|nr:hypothetical protein GALMADRAFT_135541 [Galerina marginata CBS 339.88]